MTEPAKRDDVRADKSADDKAGASRGTRPDPRLSHAGNVRLPQLRYRPGRNERRRNLDHRDLARQRESRRIAEPTQGPSCDDRRATVDHGNGVKDTDATQGRRIDRAAAVSSQWHSSVQSGYG